MQPSRLPLTAGRHIAYYHTPAFSEENPSVMFLGGFKSDMTGTKALFLEAGCREWGWGFTRFDYLGHGQSSGKFEDGTIGLWKENALAVLDQITHGPQILVGSSMGGWITLLAALARPERIAGLIGIASAPDFTEELIWNQLNESQKSELLKQGIYNFPTEYCNDPQHPCYPITLELIEEGRKHLLLKNSIPIGCPVRLIHGMQDKDVPYQTSIRLAEKLGSGVHVTLIKGGDHRMSSPESLEEIKIMLGNLKTHLQLVNTAYN